MPYADTPAACEQRRAPFDRRYRPRAPKAGERLGPDWERLITFSQCPRAHGRHLRTTNVVASPVAAGRRRTTAAKRVKKVDAAPAMSWKVLQVAEKTLRRLNARRDCRRCMPVQHPWIESNSALSTTRRLPPDPIYTLIDKTSSLQKIIQKS
jgi:transposase-like protein